MIRQIEVRNFAVARDLSIELGPGLSAFTGETGAGKSLIVDALGFAFGGRSGREVVAPGADRASVAVTLETPGGTRVVERVVGLSGRSTARVDGAPSTLDELRALGERHLDIHGQSGQLALLRPGVQLSVLDGYAGTGDHRERMAALARDLRAVRRRIDSLRTDEQERERLADRLRYELDEITAAALVQGEDDALRAEQRRLAGADALRELAAEAVEALDGGAVEQASAALASIGDRDETAGDLADLGSLLQSTAEEALRAARAYAEAIESDPGRLAELNERLDLIARLKRKYGDSVAAILEYARSAKEQLDSLSGAEMTAEELEAKERALAGEAASVAEQLSRARREAAVRLAGATEHELHLLGMTGASLALGFECRDAEDGLAVALPDYERLDGAAGDAIGAGEHSLRAFSETGVDRVEFLVSFNPGMAPKPLADVASGGETSRFLLALTAVFGTAADPRTIVLDEVDEGVGGRAGALVGDALNRLAERHQVLCITHLPQVAAFAREHFVVSKHTDGRETWSSIARVEDAGRVDELAEMLGGATGENRSAAAALLERTP